MRFLIACGLLLLLCPVVIAADATTAMLNAPFVEEFITLSLAPDNDGKTIVKYTIDGGSSPRTADGVTLRSSDEISIHVHHFNPLTTTWTVAATATPDVSYAAIKSFLDDLLALQQALPSPPAAATPTGPPAGGAAPALTGCALLHDLTRKTYEALKTPEINAATLKSIVNSAHGHAGVGKASTDLVSTQTTIEANVKTARDALAAIRKQFGSLDAPATQQCNVTGDILVNYIEVHSTADRIIAAKEALYTQLGQLITILEPYLKPENWRGPALNDYWMKSITTTFAEQQNIAVSAKRRNIQLIGTTLTLNSDETNLISSAFSIRKHSFFVAERAAALVYNNITYPQYGTATDAAGRTVVARTEDHEPINGALMLNLVMRLGRGASVVHPMIQFGVSSAKDFPGFLAGAGFRFSDPFNFSLSFGGMITRYKDLDDELAVGDVVSGTAEINEHLAYETSPVAVYGAIQLKF